MPEEGRAQEVKLASRHIGRQPRREICAGIEKARRLLARVCKTDNPAAGIMQ